jgi:hypothetical protein
MGDNSNTKAEADIMRQADNRGLDFTREHWADLIKLYSNRQSPPTPPLSSLLPTE